MKLSDLRITITEDDERKGVRFDWGQCGIVQAFHRLYPEFTNIVVTADTISASRKDLRLRFSWSTPLPARKRISGWDRKAGGFEGYSFTLLAADAEVRKMKPAAPATPGVAKPPTTAARREQLKRARVKRMKAARRSSRRAA